MMGQYRACALDRADIHGPRKDVTAKKSKEIGTLFRIANMHLRVGYLSLRCAKEK
jgi:hypothetical protein